MSITNQVELRGISKVSEVVADTLSRMREYAKVGMTTKELDAFGGSLLRKSNARSAPNVMYGFPGFTCISVNNEVAHGIPSETKILQNGDLVNIDVSAELNGYFSDNGCSFVLGDDIRQLAKLVDTSKEALRLALRNIKGGVRISDVGGLIEGKAKANGFKVIRNLVGHGIGRKLHEAPFEIPCYKDKDNKQRFKKNSVVAIETFVSTGASLVREKGDGWTYVTTDGSYVCQHEHTIIVTDHEPIILTHNNGIW